MSDGFRPNLDRGIALGTIGVHPLKEADLAEVTGKKGRFNAVGTVFYAHSSG
ncbi:hypothetical protein [Nitrobacter sp. JJSN]|uniref:hypothetical protein n=1 Tax=Nitrobacter sp. JJSN TaxID=3453033 RepID=UPI003F759CD1